MAGVAFIIRPFGKKKDSGGREIDFEKIDEDLISPALRASGFTGGTVGEIVEAGSIKEDMFREILRADLVVADITIHNANVFYELGIRHSLRKRATVMIKAKTQDRSPFDLAGDRYLGFDADDPGKSLDELTKVIRATLASSRVTDSPIFQMLPSLAEPVAAGELIVPLDFREEVERAKRAKSKGWLRLLAEDIEDRTFRRSALALVGAAQSHVNDNVSAKRTFEALRDLSEDDVAVNLALANTYDRLARADKGQTAQYIEASDQAVDRVLKKPHLARKDKSEAMALRTRNIKTRIRLDLEGVARLEDRRQRAVERLRPAVDGYFNAYREDFNAFYPGLQALWSALLFLDLTRDTRWMVSFKSDSEAKAYKEALEKKVAVLGGVLGEVIEREIGRLETGDDLDWAMISEADHAFLVSEDEERIVARYRAALADLGPFPRDSVARQLELSEMLGFKAPIARAVLEAIGSASREKVHAILFAGHRLDEVAKDGPRFPASLEMSARAKILEQLKLINKGRDVLIAYASAAPGGDILFLEACRELGIRTKMCLPMPAADYVREAFGTLDDWRSRFIDLHQSALDAGADSVLVLSTIAELPKWLVGSKRNQWERGNRWVLHMGQADADRTTLLALWDERKEGRGPGGTAHMVELARASKHGLVDVRIISTSELG